MGNKQNKELEQTLTISDWITFLTGEKYGVLGTFINIGAFFLAAMAIILAADPNPISRVIPLSVFGVYIVYFLVLRMAPFQTKGKAAEKILGRIISGELKKESDIRGEWMRLTASKMSRQTKRGVTHMKKRWVWIIISVFLVVVGLAVLAQFQKDNNTVAKWAIDFLTNWANALTAIATVLLAFTAFWVIFETRQFNYLDKRTTVVASLNKWAAESFKRIVILSRFSASDTEFKRNFMDCRAECQISVAESIAIFAQSRSFINTLENNDLRQELNNKTDNVDLQLKDFIDKLFAIDLDNPNDTQLNAVINRALTLTTNLRELMEISSQL
jgi:hypothetical protein